MPRLHRSTLQTTYDYGTPPWATGAPGAMTTWEAKEIGDTPYQRAVRAERESDKPKERA